MSTRISWVKNLDGSQGECWNPIVGCAPAGPGCQHCYAKELHDKRHEAWKQACADNSAAVIATGDGMVNHYEFTCPKQYHKSFDVVQCLPERLDMPLHWKRPRTIFVDSMSDLFHEAVPDEFIEAVFGIMSLCGRHTFIVLTKRPERMRRWFADRTEGTCQAEVCLRGIEFDTPVRKLDRTDSTIINDWPLPNLYLGLSASTQEDLDSKIGDFLEVPGKKILSLEPLLGPIQIYTSWLDALNGLIVGCESGTNRRSANTEWFRALSKFRFRNFYLKQMEIDGKVVREPFLDGRQHLELPWVILGASTGGE